MLKLLNIFCVDQCANNMVVNFRPAACSLYEIPCVFMFVISLARINCRVAQFR